MLKWVGRFQKHDYSYFKGGILLLLFFIVIFLKNGIIFLYHSIKVYLDLDCWEETLILIVQFLQKLALNSKIVIEDYKQANFANYICLLLKKGDKYEKKVRGKLIHLLYALMNEQGLLDMVIHSEIIKNLLTISSDTQVVFFFFFFILIRNCLKKSLCTKIYLL
jgi:hypothetical protein